MYSLIAHVKHGKLSNQLDLVDIDQQAAAHSALSTTSHDGWHLVCWGDPASAHEDALIASALLNQRPFTAWGRSWMAVNRLSGQFLAGVDAVGTFPILLHEHENGDLTLASSRHALRTELPNLALSPASMRSLAAFGQLFDDQSIFANVRQLPGRTLLSKTHGDVLHIAKPDTPILCNWETKFGDALDAFVEAVRCCLRHDDQPFISLSGGLDSRLILAAMTALGAKPKGLTYGHASSADVSIARQLASAAGIPLFTSQPMVSNQAWELFQRTALLGGGEVAVHHAHAIADPSLLSQTGSNTLITGTGAETARAFYYDRGMPGYRLFGESALKRFLMPKAQTYVMQEYMRTANAFFQLAPQWQESLSAELGKRIAQSASKHSQPALFMDNFYLENRVSRMVAAGQHLLDQHYFRSHPFLNRDALFYMGHLPTKLKLGSTFHRMAIEKLAPKLAAVTWDRTNQPLHAGIPFDRRYPALASRFGVQAWGKVSAPMHDYQDILMQLPAESVRRSLEQMDCLAQRKSEVDWQVECAMNNQNLKGFSAVWSCLTPSKSVLMSA